jgi:hypothetical protein
MGFTIPTQELIDQVFGEATGEVLLQFQARYRLPRTGVFDEATQTLLSRVVRSTGSASKARSRWITGCQTPGPRI